MDRARTACRLAHRGTVALESARLEIVSARDDASSKENHGTAFTATRRQARLPNGFIDNSLGWNRGAAVGGVRGHGADLVRHRHVSIFVERIRVPTGATVRLERMNRVSALRRSDTFADLVRHRLGPPWPALAGLRVATPCLLESRR